MIEMRTVGFGPPSLENPLGGIVHRPKVKETTVNPTVIVEKLVDPRNKRYSIALGTTWLLEEGISSKRSGLNLYQDFDVAIHAVCPQSLPTEVLSLLFCFLVHVLCAAVRTTKRRAS